MTTVFELTPQRVRGVVPEGAVGFYRLGTVDGGQFWPTYFGRSDRGLQSRLLTHSRERLDTHFAPVVTRTIERAYQMECREWHLHGEGMENKIHPARPKQIAYECPYCGLEHRIATA